MVNNTVFNSLRISWCDVPSVYSNKQSYYDCLCYLDYKINECINAINSYTNEYKKYTDEEIIKLREYVDELNSSMKEYVDSKNLELTELINNNYSTLDSKIDYVNRSLISKIEKLTEIVYKLNSDVYAYINSELEKVYDYIEKYACINIKAYNPTNGKYESIQKCLDDIYGKLRYFGITCSEFDQTGLTCDMFESYNLTASEFDMYAGYKFFKSPVLYMFDPFTGEYVFYQSVINKLADFHRKSPITVTEFEELSITCESFDSKEITAFQFDNNAKQLLS